MLVCQLLKNAINKEKITESTISKLPLNERFKKRLLSFIKEKLGDIIDSEGHVADLKAGDLSEYPMTHLERRWLKSISLDPIVQLFDIDWSELNDVDPLYYPDDIVYFDQQNTSDPWTDETYRQNFRMILDAWQLGKQLTISWYNRADVLDQAKCWPELIEYDQYEDKMRLMARTDDHIIAIVLGRIQSCAFCNSTVHYETKLHTDRHLPAEDHLEEMQEAREQLRKSMDVEMPVLSIQILDEKLALERTLALFGHYQKKDFCCKTANQYILEIYLDPYDEIDDIIDNILYLGPYVELLGPQAMIEALKARFERV
jgi:predicted DNA-binding transcriptional regulator YafY